MSRTWLVAHDFSEHAERSCARAVADLKAMGGGEILLVHVHSPLSTGFGFELTGSVGFGDVDRVVQEDASTRLQRIADRLGAEFPEIAFRAEVALGRPADTISEIARREDVELIVVGSHGRRGLERFFLGSVAERVLRLAGCSVLVVKIQSKGNEDDKRS